MANKFNISELYTWLASYKGLPFPVNIKDYLPYKQNQWSNRVGLITGKETFANLYGKPVVVPVSIGSVMLGSGEEGNISIQPLVMIEGSKTIVETPIAGASYTSDQRTFFGTVKEFISINDYRIRIFGAVINPNQKEYPTDQVAVLKHLWSYNGALTFSCEITDDLFSFIVIKNIKFDELRMSPGVQFYEIQAVSDGTQEVEMLRNDNA